MKFRYLLSMLIFISLVFLPACEGEQKQAREHWEAGEKLKPTMLNLYLPTEPQSYSHYYGKQLVDKMPSELIKHMKKLNIELKIGNVVFVGPPLMAKVETSYETAITLGKDMDLFIINNPNNRVDYTESIITDIGKMGYAADLSGLFSEFAPKYYNRFKKEELMQLSHKGRLLAVPSLNLPSTRRVCAVIRDDLLNAYGIKTISSLEDYEKFLNMVKTKDPGFIPVLYGERSTFDLLGKGYGLVNFYLYGMNLVYRWNDPEMKLVPWEQTDEFMEIASKLRSWRTKKYADEIRRPDMLDIASGKYASFIAVTGAAEAYNQILDTEGGKNWRYVEYDLFPDSVSLRDFNPFPFICVNPLSSNKERVLMFIEWLMDHQEAYDIFMYGIEGKDFTYDAEGKPKARVPTGYLLEYDSYMACQSRWSFRNIFMQHEDEKLLKNKIRSVEKITAYYPHSGFVPDEEALANAVKNIDLKITERKKAEEGIVAGKLTEVEIQDFIDSQRPQTEILTTVLQHQLDEWRSEQDIN